MNIQTIIPAKAESVYPLSQSTVTISVNTGAEDQIASDWWNETDTFHALFSDSLLRVYPAAFTLCPLKHGIRKNENAEPTSILAIDFDDPECSIEKVRSYFRDCDYVIYTTRNHQKEKHGKAPCDRFRIVLPLDKPLDPLALPAIVDFFGRILHADTACKDGARFFFFGNPTSLIFRNVNPLRLSVEWLLSNTPPVCAFRASTGATRTQTTGKPLVLGTKKPHSKHIGFLRDAWDNVRDKHQNTFEAVFQLMLIWIQNSGNDLEALKAALPEVEEVEAFYQRHPHQWKSIDATLDKAMSFVCGNTKNTIVHRNTVEEVDTATITLAPDMAQASRAAGACLGPTGATTEIEDAAKLIGHVFNTHKKAILDIQCGIGKTLVASAFVASSKDRWLVVKDTLQACQSQRDLMTGYGVETHAVKVLSGWRCDMCKANQDRLAKLYPSPNTQKRMKQEFGDRVQTELALGSSNWTAFYDKKNSPCVKCWATWCDFKASRTHKKIIGVLKSKRVVVMSHARFLELVHWGQKAIEGFKILIDEEPALFEGVSFASTEVDLIRHTFAKCLKGKVDGHIDGLMSNPKAGTIEDFVSFDHKELKTLQGRCAKLAPEDKEVCYRYLHFMGYGADRFATVETDVYGKKLSFVRNRLNWTLDNDTYVLNASSRFGLAEWDGFTVVRSTVQSRAAGACVYGYEANSTKHRLDKEATSFLKYALGIIKTNGRKKILLALNKDESQTTNIKTAVQWFKGECQKIGVQVDVAERGSIIGRNDWRDCDCVVLAYGLFTTVSNVALKQSLVEGSEIDGSRIWDTKTIHGVEVRQPKIRTGFVDSGLRETDRRLFADEVYQVGLRGVARNWKGDSQDIICLCPSMDYLIPVTQALPECKIVFGKLDLSAIPTSSLLQNDSTLTKVFGITGKDKTTETTARKMAQGLIAARLAE